MDGGGRDSGQSSTRPPFVGCYNPLPQLADSSPAPFPYPASDYLGFGSHAVHPREGLVENLYLTGDWHLVIGSQLLVTRVLNLSQLRPFLYV